MRAGNKARRFQQGTSRAIALCNRSPKGRGSGVHIPSRPVFTTHCVDPLFLTPIRSAGRDAWQNKKPFKANEVGIAYMLAGDVGSSNTDPYADAPTSNNQWVEPGPHLMVVVPNPAALEGISTDPYSGGPFVMWKGTPYVHIMVPVGKRPEAKR